MGQIHMTLLYEDGERPVVAQTEDVTIWLEALDGTWVVCGVDTAVGVLPESVQLHADRRGFSTASFDLKRRADVIWPDIGAWTPVIVEIGGVERWRGLAGETPIRDAGAETVISVQCRGRQFDLDADVYRPVYVHTKLADWRDVRSWSETVLGAAAACAAGQVNGESGSMQLSIPNGSALVPGAWVGIALDLGEACARHVTVEWESSNNTDQFVFYCRAAESPDQNIAYSSGTAEDPFTIASNGGASGTSIGWTNNPHRYVQLFIFNPAFTGTTSLEHWWRIKAVRVVTDPAGPSIVKASMVLNDALDRTIHGLSPDRSQIQPSDYIIPDLAPGRFVTIGEIGDAVNAWHNRILKVDRHHRLVFRDRPTAPELEIGAWPGSTFTDAAANSGDGIHNRAIVEGQHGDGTPTIVDRAADQAMPGAGLTLVGVPQPANPFFETDASGWTAVDATIARSTARYASSPASLAVTPRFPSGGVYSDIVGLFEPGVTYEARLDLANPDTFATATILQFGASAEDRTVMVLPPALGWRQVTIRWTPRRAATNAALGFASGYVGGGVGIWIDNVTISRAFPTLADRRGRRQPRIIQPSFAISPDGGQQLTDTFLRGHQTTPLRGEAVIGIGGARHVLGGHPEHPAGLLSRTCELLGLAHRIDPDTGAVGRHGEIATVGYDHATGQSTVGLDDNRGDFDALAARLESVQGAG